ncbi:DUF4174 domain-containing protein [Microbulbifer sp. SSSA002]|uniref:DUF4174 domain-containing protein n=1 Tax=Microbulbifer sp. SSSA002 TaxID=3243376 RepID=UPI004039BE6D
MHKLTAFFLLLYTAISCAQGPSVSDLKDFQWKNRILLLNIPGNPDNTVNELLKLAPQFAERDLLWFLFSDEALETNYGGEVSDNFPADIKNSYFPGEGTKIVLIGKDGEVKYTAKTLSAKTLFQRIDSMPMRRHEMRQGSGP